MSRPFSIVPWANGANYPAGSNAWNATPLKTAISPLYYVPGVLGAAQGFNYATNRSDQAAIAALNYSGQIPAQTWQVKATAPGSQNNLKASYDGFARRWFMTGGPAPAFASGGNLVFYAVDGGQAWYPAETAITVSPTGGATPCAVWSIASRASDGKCVVMTQGSPSFGGGLANFGTFTGGLAHYFAGGGVFVMFGMQSGAQILITSPDGVASTTRTLPAGIGTGTAWFVASSPSSVLVCGNNLGNTTIATSPTGATWTAQNLTITSGETVVGLTYATGIGYVIAVNNAAGDSRVLVSADEGVTWFVSATLTGLKFGGIAACGALIVATTTFRGLGRILTSFDGGQTFQFGALGYSLAQAVSGTEAPIYAATGGLTQFLAVQPGGHAFSGVAGAGS
jgi:hypothetical protein